MVWSIFTTMRFSLSLLFRDPLPLTRAAIAILQRAAWRGRQQIPGCVQRTGDNRHDEPPGAGSSENIFW